MVEPIDLQQTMDRAQLAEKIQQAMKDMPEDQHLKFLKEMEKEHHKRNFTVHESEESDPQNRIRDDENGKGGARHHFSQKKKQNLQENASDEDSDDFPSQGHMIDIKA